LEEIIEASFIKTGGNYRSFIYKNWRKLYKLPFIKAGGNYRSFIYKNWRKL